MLCEKKRNIINSMHTKDVSVYVWEDGVVTAYLPQFTRFNTIEQAKEAFYPMADSPFSDFQVTDFLNEIHVYLKSVKLLCL